MRNMYVLIPALFMAILLKAHASVEEVPGNGPPPEKPHIILILADDMGVFDLGSYGQEFIKTPHLDRLAAEGMRFTQFYANGFCSPTRASLFSGNFQHNNSLSGFPGPENDYHGKLPVEENRLPQVMRDAGYRTTFYGKWHVGPYEEMWPLWDHAYVPRQENHFGTDMVFYPEVMLKNGESEPIPANEGEARAVYSEDLYIKDLEREIANWSDRPQFVYFASHIPHQPYLVPEQSRVAYDGKIAERPKKASGKYVAVEHPNSGYAGMISHLDGMVGRMLAALELRGDARPVLILFASDNGPKPSPEEINSAGPLRGFKGMPFEGGVRVPLIAWCPGHVPAGTVSDYIGHVCDMLPTFAELAGIEPPGGLDGISFAPTLIDHRPQQQHPYLAWGSTIRKGPWKYIGRRDEEMLFNLVTDIGETRNLAASEPELLEEMRALSEQQ